MIFKLTEVTSYTLSEYEKKPGVKIKPAKAAN